MKRRLLSVLLTLALLSPRQVRAEEPRDARALALSPDLAFADPIDPNPGSGRGRRIAGWVGLGVGVVEGANVALCLRVEELRGARSPRACVTLAASLATLGLLLGVPLTISGHRQRARQRAWLQRHGLSALEHLRGGARPGAAELGWQLRF